MTAPNPPVAPYRQVRIVIEFRTDAGDDELAMLAAHAAVQVEDPADDEGEHAWIDTRYVHHTVEVVQG